MVGLLENFPPGDIAFSGNMTFPQKLVQILFRIREENLQNEAG
jgi:hypothetical protein